jgi:hypothetical protein
MTLPVRSRRALRSIKQSVPTGVVLGRRSVGDGPAEFIPLDEIIGAQLDAISAVRGSVLYRGAADWVALPPGSAGQVLQTNGSGADPTWETVSGGGGGDTELDFDPPTLTILPINRQTAAAFTATATDVIGKGLSLFLNPTGAGDKVLARLKVAPVAPFTLTARVRQTQANALGEAGLILYNSTTNRSLRVLLLTTGRVFSQQWSALETFNATIATGVAVVGHPAMIWLRITVTALGAVSFFFSFDGVFFKAIGTTTLATYLTAAGGTLDEVGVHARANGVDTSAACFHFYRES